MQERKGLHCSVAINNYTVSSRSTPARLQVKGTPCLACGAAAETTGRQRSEAEARSGEKGKALTETNI